MDQDEEKRDLTREFYAQLRLARNAQIEQHLYTADLDDGHEPRDWLMILDLQMGKLDEAVDAYEAGIEGAHAIKIRNRMIEIAAVCSAAYESYERMRIKRGKLTTWEV